MHFFVCSTALHCSLFRLWSVTFAIEEDMHDQGNNADDIDNDVRPSQRDSKSARRQSKAKSQQHCPTLSKHSHNNEQPRKKDDKSSRVVEKDAADLTPASASTRESAMTHPNPTPAATCMQVDEPSAVLVVQHRPPLRRFSHPPLPRRSGLPSRPFAKHRGRHYPTCRRRFATNGAPSFLTV